MKTFLTLSLHLLISSFLWAQAPQGIPYQAVIRDNVGAPLVNASVTVRFTLHQNTIDGPVEYQETQSLSTNAFGVINTQFGMGMATQGGFENIIWSNTTKFIQVEANDGSGYLDMGTQQMMSVPYAMYSSKSENSTHADNGFSNVSVTGDTLYMANGNFIIVPGISAANYPAPVLGCTNAQACNYNAAATQDDGFCLYQNATCDDGDVNTTNDVINSECVCAGTILPPPLYTMGNGVTDFDGNFYPSIIINGQEWIQKNLAVSKYRNGDPVPTGLSDATWSSTTSGAYAIYNNDAANNTTYGKLYNWYAVNDSRGLCPSGWHVPSDAEWTTLINYLDPNADGGNNGNIAGGKMKSTGTIENGDGLWNSPNEQATNESGFTALPGGYRYNVGSYYDVGYFGVWWSSTEYDSNYAWGRVLGYDYSNVFGYYGSKQDGFSVRCVRD
jgi:uncharacterized protein (TIGR02145 family)